MPSDAVTDPDYFDDSSRVPCSEPHTTETVEVLRLSEPTIAEAKEATGACWDPVAAYLGVDLDHWVHWRFVTFLWQLLHSCVWFCALICDGPTGECTLWQVTQLMFRYSF